MILKTYDSGKDKQVAVGHYYAINNTFVKKVKPKHYMIKEKGYGIQDEIMAQLCQLDCKTITIETKTKTYEVDFDKWFNQPPKDYGHGRQKFMSVEQMNDQERTKN